MFQFVAEKDDGPVVLEQSSRVAGVAVPGRLAHLRAATASQVFAPVFVDQMISCSKPSWPASFISDLGFFDLVGCRNFGPVPGRSVPMRVSIALAEAVEAERQATLLSTAWTTFQRTFWSS